MQSVTDTRTGVALRRGVNWRGASSHPPVSHSILPMRSLGGVPAWEPTGSVLALLGVEVGVVMALSHRPEAVLETRWLRGRVSEDTLPVTIPLVRALSKATATPSPSDPPSLPLQVLAHMLTVQKLILAGWLLGLDIVSFSGLACWREGTCVPEGGTGKPGLWFRANGVLEATLTLHTPSVEHALGKLAVRE